MRVEKTLPVQFCPQNAGPLRPHGDLDHKAAVQQPTGQCGSALLERLLKDHVAIRRLLSALRDCTDGYRPPQNACTAWRLLYVICLRIEHLILARIRLEEAELFPIEFGSKSAAFDADQGAGRVSNGS